MKNKWKLARQHLTYLSLRKGVNLFLLYVSFYYSRWTGSVKMLGLPTSLSIEPTTSCNLRCPECTSGLRNFTRPTGMLDPILFKKVIDELAPHLTYLNLYFQGEPYLNPKFFELVAYGDSNKIFTSTSTNAHFLSKDNIEKTVASGLKQLIVSVDGATQEIYENYRIGGRLEKVTKGIQDLITYRNSNRKAFPLVILQFLVTGVNEHQIPEIKKLAVYLNVDDVQLKTAQINDFQQGSSLMPKDLQYSRYIPNDKGGWKLKKTMENKCWRMWQGAVITWDGKVVPCCFDKDAKHVMGEVTKENFTHIWNKPIYKSFRNQLLEERAQIEMCKNCTE